MFCNSILGYYQKHALNLKKQPPQVFYRKRYLNISKKIFKHFAKLVEKHVRRSLFMKAAALFQHPLKISENQKISMFSRGIENGLQLFQKRDSNISVSWKFCKIFNKALFLKTMTRLLPNVYLKNQKLRKQPSVMFYNKRCS